MAADYERFLAYRGYVSYWISEFSVPHLISLLKHFKGDVMAAVIIGEIARHNYQHLISALKGPVPDSMLMPMLDNCDRDATLSPCNALSISYATGIPRETVRRKIAELVRRSLVVRDGRRHLRVAPHLSAKFSDFGFEQYQRMMRVAERLQQLEELPVAGARMRTGT